MAYSLEHSLDHYGLKQFPKQWSNIKRGIEKESLRITPAGQLAASAHPTALGSALTNPYITTDFSEALLEFITPAYGDIGQALQMLEDIHRFVYSQLGEEELLWVGSMPGPVQEQDIPIAQYGSSNIGRLKTLYRHGLSHRYGSMMQVISGLHYNFSMPEEFWPEFQQQCGNKDSEQEFRTARYLHLIRNFHRYSWLLIYLFGASPAATVSFPQNPDHGLDLLGEDSLYLPFATCLRMGRLGYKSEAQKSLFVCYNELETYVECLDKAMRSPYPDYEAIGQRRDGNYLQINTNLLQLENEFYSTIRPKRVVASGERPLAALMRGGIEYIEVRALDLNPYLPLGIDAEQIRFLDAFLLHCLLAESPVCDKREFFEVSQNIAKVVEHGRDPELELTLESEPHSMRQWAAKLLDEIGHAAALLDSSHGGDQYQRARGAQVAKLDNPELTPSGRMLADMQDEKLSHFQLLLQLSQQTQKHFHSAGLSAARMQDFVEEATRSIQQQADIEASDEVEFDEFLKRWNEA